MTLQQFFTMVLARWRSALLVFSLLVATTLVATLMLPKQYRASATVMLDMRSPDPLAGPAMAAMATPAYMATQVDLISSERVLRKAIRTLGLTDNPELQRQWREETEGQGEFEVWLSELMLKRMEVKPARDANIITVSYSSPDPRFSAGLTNALVQAYLDTTVELRADPARRYTSFFDARAKSLREALEAAQTRLSEYQAKKGLLPNDERFDVENARLAELSSQLVMLQALAAESGGRQSQAGARPEQMPEVLANPVVAGLSAEVAREESRLQELATRVGPNHPQLQSARTQLNELRSKLDDATRRASGSVNVNNSVNQGRVAQVRASLEAQRARVMQLKSMRDEAAVLQRDVENAQRAYDSMSLRVNQTAIESQNTMTNVAIIKQASAPASHATPRLWLNLVIAVVLGSLLGCATAVVRELRDRRLRSADDVRQALQQRLLVTLPVSKLAVRGPDSARVAQMKTRVLTGSLKPVAKAG
jgi:polysaccharide biosynthesis transport protein